MHIYNYCSFTVDSGDSGCPHTAKVLLAIFRQLCVLLWYLHVRENATLHFRRLQSLANGCQVYNNSKNLHCNLCVLY